MEWRKRFKYSTYALLTTIVAIAIFFVFNLILGKLDFQIDMSTDQKYSLSKISKDTIKSIDKDVTINLAYNSELEKKYETENQNYTHLSDYEKYKLKIKKILNKYQNLNSHIKVNEFNVTQNQELSQKYGLNTDSLCFAVIVECGDKYKVMNDSDLYSYDYETQIESFVGEQVITNSIKNITAVEKKNVYYLTGHDEYDITQDKAIYNQLVDTNYQLQELNLTTSDIPENTDILLILTPASDLTTEEATKINMYMENGGKAFVTILPYFSETYPNFTALLNKWGITTNYNIVFEEDKDKKLDDTGIYFFADIKTHDITKNIINANYKAVAIDTTVIDILNNNEKYEVTPIVTSSKDSYSKDMSLIYDTGDAEKAETDSTGPFNLGVAIEKKISDTNSMKAVVLASNYFINSDSSYYYAYSEEYSKVFASQTANTDLTYNSLAWLKGAMDEISVRPKVAEDTALLMSQGKLTFTSWLVLVFIPLILLLFGFMVCYKRRSKE